MDKINCTVDEDRMGNLTVKFEDGTSIYIQTGKKQNSVLTVELLKPLTTGTVNPINFPMSGGKKTSIV